MSWSVHPIGLFPELAGEWGRINAGGWNTPLMDPAFVAPLIREFATGEERLAVFRDDGRIRAIGAFEKSGRQAWQTFQPVVSPLGAWIAEPGLDIRGLLDSLVAALPGFPLLVAISQQDPLLAPRPADGRRLRTVDYIPTARVAVASSFDEWWSARGKNLRHSFKRTRNKLAREGIDVRFEMLTEPGDMARAVADYARLETAGWKGKADSAVRGDNALGRFYTAMLTSFCERGEGLVYRYLYDGRLVASDLCIHHAGTVVILKTAYDESERATSPAQLMRNDAFRHFFDSGAFNAIEFYGRVMDWHTKLTDDVRTMYHVNGYRFGVLSRLHKPKATEASERYLAKAGAA